MRLTLSSSGAGLVPRDREARVLDADVSLVFEEDEPTVTAVEEGDANLNKESTAGVAPVQLVVIPKGELATVGRSSRSLTDAGQGTFDVVTGKGPARVVVSRNGDDLSGPRQEFALTIPATTTTEFYEVQSYDGGSWVRKHNDALETAMGSGSSNLWTDANKTAWNTGAWFADWLQALSGISRNLQTTVTLIAPRVGAAVSHYAPSVGQQVSWLGTDNVVHTRTVIAESPPQQPGVEAWGNDRKLLLFDSALPAAVRPLRVIPTVDGYIDRLAEALGVTGTDIHGSWGPHVMWPDFNGVMRVSSWACGSPQSASYPAVIVAGVNYGVPDQAATEIMSPGVLANSAPWNHFSPYHGTNYRAKAGYPSSGNSGNPVLLPLPDGTVALVILFSSPQNGPLFVDATAELNAMIAELYRLAGVAADGAMTVTEADLDQYP